MKDEKAIKKLTQKKWFRIAAILALVFAVVLSIYTINFPDAEATEAASATEAVTESEAQDTDTWSKEIAESNAEEYPAGPGRVLVTKGDRNFTGMPYYFKGKLKAMGTADAFGDKVIWLLQNDAGYVMPVDMTGEPDATIDDDVEIWGTLTGEGYELPNVDNVVGETGFMRMIQYDINGEPQI